MWFNSFREKPEETGPWTESRVASPSPGPYGKTSPGARPGGGGTFSLDSSGEDLFPDSSVVRVQAPLFPMTPRALTPRLRSPSPAPKFEGCGWSVPPPLVVPLGGLGEPGSGPATGLGGLLLRWPLRGASGSPDRGGGPRGPRQAEERSVGAVGSGASPPRPPLLLPGHRNS